jgi:hypothetical protein
MLPRGNLGRVWGYWVRAKKHHLVIPGDPKSRPKFGTVARFAYLLFLVGGIDGYSNDSKADGRVHCGGGKFGGGLPPWWERLLQGRLTLLK